MSGIPLSPYLSPDRPTHVIDPADIQLPPTQPIEIILPTDAVQIAR